MNVVVHLEGTYNEEDSLRFTELANLIEQNCEGLVEVQEKSYARGIKDGGLAIAIAVLGLGASAISTLVSVLAYWGSQQEKYSLTMTRGNMTFTIDNMSAQQLEETVRMLEAETSSSDVSVQVLSKDSNSA